MTSAARLTIDLDALAHNYMALRQLASGAEVAPVVKADGYGLGAGPVARRLQSEGARSFYVARLSEGEALRAALGEGPDIFVLDGCTPGSADRLRAARLAPVLNSLEQVDEFAAIARANATLAAALHIDTGMSRLGLRPQEAQELAAAPGRLEGIDLQVVVSHLACADEPDNIMNERQGRDFMALRQLFAQARASLANSGGVFLPGQPACDQVRPGICLYGGGPEGRADPRLRQVARFEAPIVQVRQVFAGETIGYGAAFVAKAPLSVAVVAAGYADGFLRSGASLGFAWFDGARRRLLGRLSMDLIALDVTGCGTAKAGQMVELLGPNAPVDEVAEAAGTIAYEVLARLSPRAERVYLGER